MGETSLQPSWPTGERCDEEIESGLVCRESRRDDDSDDARTAACGSEGDWLSNFLWVCSTGASSYIMAHTPFPGTFLPSSQSSRPSSYSSHPSSSTTFIMSTPMLNGADVASSFSKSLPLVSKDDDLPKPPLSSPSRDELPLPPPPLPPKINCDIPEGEEIPSTHSASAARSAPTSPFRETLSIPEISSPPESPSFASTSHSSSPQSLSAVDARPKKANPFVDLMETEKSYVDTLSGIIRVSWFAKCGALFTYLYLIFRKLRPLGLDPISHPASWTLCFEVSRPSSKPIAFYLQS